MSFKKLVLPAFVFGAAYMAACGSSDAPIGDSFSGSTGVAGSSSATSGSGGSAGSGTASGGSTSTSAGANSGGAGGGCVGVHSCPAISCEAGATITTAPGECCPSCSGGSGGASSNGGSSGASTGGAGGGCTGVFNCPAILCVTGASLATPPGECCPVCTGGGGGSSGGGAGGVSGGSSGGASGGGGVGGCSGVHVCPLVVTICKAGESPTPASGCCPTCVLPIGTAGAGGSASPQ